MQRQVLARYVDQEPGTLRFTLASFGKPALAPSAGHGWLRFNTSGSEALALVAVRRDVEVGVDVERLRPLPDVAALADRLLTAAERSEIAALPEPRKALRFFETWVRKEALTKMLGLGLRQPFAGLSLHPWPGGEARHIHLPAEAGAGAAWLLPLAPPRPGFVAALAAAAPFAAVRRGIWNPRDAR